MSLKKFSKNPDTNLSQVVTPMLDMAFQLLAFFILTYRPASLQEGYFAGELLPAKEEPKAGPAKEPNLEKKDEEPELEEIIKVKVSSVPKGTTYAGSEKLDGMPEKVEVEFPSRTEVVGDQNTKVGPTMIELAKQLKAYVASAKGAGEGGPTLKLIIESDDMLKHQYFINIYDACKAANFDSVSFAQPPGLKNTK